MKSGIYEIRNLVNGKAYIGSACYISSRLATHRHNLRTGKHRNRKLLNAWNCYGEDAFEFKPIIYCDKKNLVMYEQLIIDGLNSVSDGYNILAKAGSNLGFKHSPEHITSLIGNSRALGMTHSEDTRRRISKSLEGNQFSLGVKKSEHARRRVSETMLGRKQSPEQIAKKVAAYKATVQRRKSAK